jgi:hypothetical protein
MGGEAAKSLELIPIRLALREGFKKGEPLHGGVAGNVLQVIADGVDELPDGG